MTALCSLSQQLEFPIADLHRVATGLLRCGAYVEFQGDDNGECGPFSCAAFKAAIPRNPVEQDGAATCKARSSIADLRSA
jgi:hypothetical protein